MSDRSSRREFLKQAAVVGAAAAAGCHNGNGEPTTHVSHPVVRAEMNPSTMPTSNNKLNVAFIGVGGKGQEDTGGISASPNVNVVAICDVDDRNLSQGAVEVAQSEGV
jgi:hypothetical protein